MIATKNIKGMRAHTTKATPAQLRVSTCVRSAETETVQQTELPKPAELPKVDFSPNTQAATGYVDFDTAGQANMYPVVTKAYEAGSNQDTLETGSANLVVGAGAAAIAVAVLALGLGALSQQGGSGTEAVERLRSLTEYAAAFSTEL